MKKRSMYDIKTNLNFKTFFCQITLAMQNVCLISIERFVICQLRVSEMCVYCIALMFYLILLRWLSKRKWIIQWFIFETWQIRLQNENSHDMEFVNGLIIHYVHSLLLPPRHVCALAFTKRSFVQCVLLFYLFVKVVFPPACVKVGINTDVFMRDNPTPVNSGSLRFPLRGLSG